MKEVRTQQKYKCDFCKKQGTKSRMELHEQRCFRNPNRFCDYCENKRYTEESHGEHGIEKVGCPYCQKFDPEQLKEIEAREAGLIPEPEVNNEEPPF